jgi:hypothetical protein
MITARSDLAGGGIQTSALAFGGVQPGNSAATEKYDGISWSTSGSLNTARQGLAGAAANFDSALAFGGYSTAETGATEEYDGTSWTTSPVSLATAKSSLGGCGTQTAALAFGGNKPPPNTTATEEWTGAAPTTVTITAS